MSDHFNTPLTRGLCGLTAGAFLFTASIGAAVAEPTSAVRHIAAMTTVPAPVHHGAIVRPANFIKVIDAWSRPAQNSGVVYCMIRNISDHPVELTGISTSRAVKATIHESYTLPGKGHGAAGEMHEHAMGGKSMDDMPMTAMRPVHSLLLPARSFIVFKAGGRHIMLDGLRGELHRGQTFAMTLHFKGGLTKVAAVQVR